MYKTVESNESMRSEDSRDSKPRYKYKKRLEPNEMETESQTVPPWKRSRKRIQKDTDSTMRNSDIRLNWCTTNYKWSPKRLMAQQTNPLQSRDKKTQRNVQVDRPNRFDEIHRSMNPNSSDQAARIILADQSESKSQGCAMCRRKKSNEDTRKRKRQCFRLCRRKKKKFNEEERRLLRETNLSSMFVPLQKSTGTSPIKVETLEDNLPEYYHKSAKREDNSFKHESQEVGVSDTPKRYSKTRSPPTPVDQIIFKPESTQRVSSQPVYDEKRQKFDSDVSKSYGIPENSANITKSCCYLCVQNTIAIAATTSEKREQCNQSIQTSVDSICDKTTKYDKSCNPTPCVRTVKSSVKINTCNKSMQANNSPSTKNRTKCKGIGIPPMVEYLKYPVEQTVNNGTEKCVKCSTKSKCRRNKKQ